MAQVARIRTLSVAVCGAKQCGEALQLRAEEVGRRIAERGAVLLCGGLGGVMEAAARGAHGAGGLTVGILPGADVATASPFIRLPIATGIGFARNAILAYSCDAMIAIGGRYGTLSEIAFALDRGKPVALLDTWELAHPEHRLPHGHVVESPAEAIEWVVSRLDLADLT